MEVLDFPDAASWESWLSAHHATQTQAWLRIGKRHSGIDRVTIAEALDVALCFGWIDGQRKANDEVSFLQRFRDLVLSRGSSQDYNQMYRAFRGHAPTIDAMLKNAGLVAQ